MNRRAVLVIALFILWVFAGSYYYLCTLQGMCPGAERIESELRMPWQEEPFKLFTILNSDTLIPGDSFANGASQLLQRIGEHDTLLVQGIFGREELNGFTLAFNRASKAQVYFTGLIGVERLRSDILSREAFPEYSGDTFPGVSLVVIPYSIPEESAWIAVPFKPGTVVKQVDPRLDMRLKELVEELSTNNEKLEVTGYGYGEGSEEANFEMGRKRAWAAKKLLWDMGLDPGRIQTASEGSNDGHSDKGDRAEIRRISN